MTNTENIKLNLIVPDENQPRKMFEPAKLASLKSSVGKYGIMSPLTLEKVGEKYLIVDGERRFRVAKVLGLETVLAVVIAPQNDVDRLVQQFHIQEQHEGWSPTEKAMVLHKLSKEMGITMPQALELLGIGERTARLYLAFISLIEKGAFQKNNIGIMWAEQIKGIKSFIKFVNGEEMNRDTERGFEKAFIRRVIAGTISKRHHVTELKDSFKKKPSSVKEFIDTDITPEKLFVKTKANGAYYLRNLEYSSAYLATYITEFMKLQDLEVPASVTAKLKHAKNLLTQLINLVD